jgi:outer membrane protein TolC
MPELLALATGGYFQSDKLSQKWNYSAGIGIRLPLFEGFKTQADIQRAAAELQAEQATLQAIDQSVNESNTRYDEQIHALKVRLDYLQRENKLAHEAYELAKSRYFGFQGSLVDLREALRNLERVLTDINKAQKDLFIARGGRAIFNGVRHENSGD